MEEISRVGQYPFGCVRLSQGILSQYTILSVKSYTVHKQFMACFFDRNISMFTLLGNNLARCGSTMYPLELNTHSDGTLAPQIHRYFLTSTESNGNLLLICFHQSKGSLLVSFQDRGKPLSFFRRRRSFFFIFTSGRLFLVSHSSGNLNRC